MKQKKEQFDITELKVPPHNKDIEVSIIGILLLETSCIPLYIKKLSREFFYNENNQLVFDAIQYLFDNNQNIDMLTVTNRLRTTGQLDTVGGAYEIVKYTNHVVTSAHMETWVAILHDYYLQRQGIKIAYELAKDSYDATDINSVLNSASNNISKAQEKIFVGTEKSMLQYLMNIAADRAKVSDVGQIGLDSGYESINRLLSGWVNPDLVVIAARPAQGKTAFALNTLHHVLKQDIPVAMFSLEMSGEQLVTRLLALESDIRHTDLRHNNLTSDERMRLSIAENKLSKYKLHIDDTPALNIRDLRSKATILKRKHGIKMLVIDYLQLMSSIDKKSNREGEVSEISRGCKIIAKELDIPVIALSQLSRAVESRPDKMPQLSDLRESGSIEQDADSVIFLMRPETYNIQEVNIDGNVVHTNGLAIGKIAKNRHGGIRDVALRFKGDTMKFTDY
jgi:replicative DNA helicase